MSMETAKLQTWTAYAANEDLFINSRKGMIRFAARFRSYIRKKPVVRTTKTRSQTTVADDHGNVVAPKPSRSRVVTAEATISKLSVQSMLFNPAGTGGFGDGTLRMTSSMMKATPQIGTGQIPSAFVLKS